jgi:hypothetical protein
MRAIRDRPADGCDPAWIDPTPQHPWDAGPDGSSPPTGVSDGAADVERTNDIDLGGERRALDRIRKAQAAHLADALAAATRLADEAAEMTEEGIRDLFDEDAEADAAVQAALVRQTSDAAMHAIRRVDQLRSAGRALAFGHTTDVDGERRYVGRLTVTDGDDVLLVDWRAPAAVPFYQATPLERMGVERRRTLLYGDDSSGSPGELVGYSDELFDVDAATEELGLRGEAALLAAVAAPTREQMRSVVSTIQAEQDAVIRAPGDQPLVVQGGPGTGKTVVALHRAAYLLYAQREALSDTGVLVVGPSSEFLTYIAGVLPSLGETGVVSVTAPELYPGVRRGRAEEPAAAEVKGRLAMAELLANAVALRRRCPTDPLATWYGGRRVVLPVDALSRLFQWAGRHTLHNEGADQFRFEVIEALTDEVFDPSFHNRDDARDHFRRDRTVRRFLLRHWPPLTPEEALNDLLGSPSLLRAAARGTGLYAADLDLIARARAPFAEVDGIRWSNADLPLLDELLALVGISLGDRDDDQRIRERDEADEFELAAAIDNAGLDERDDEDLEPAAAESFDALAGAAGEPVDPMFDTSVLDHELGDPDEVGYPDDDDDDDDLLDDEEEDLDFVDDDEIQSGRWWG